MARKKQEETQPVERKKSARKPAPGSSTAAIETAKSKKAAKSAAKTAAKKVKADKPTTPVKLSKTSKSAPATRASHPAVDEAVVMAAFQGGKSLSKKELLAACGGDDIALTKTIKHLRGEGKIAVKGSTRDAVYSLAA